MAAARWSLHFAWGRAPYALDLPEVIIGRGDACSLQIEEPAAGEEHARFTVDEQDRIWLEDLGSGQPTLVNGRAIAGRTRLAENDFVQIGHSVLSLRTQTVAPEVAPAPSSAGGMATLMMESPLAIQTAERVAVPRRDPQKTVEADAGEILAALRRDPPPPAAPEPLTTRPTVAAAPPDAPTLMAPERVRRAAPGPSVTQKPTLIGVGVLTPPTPKPGPTSAPTQMLAAVVPPDEPSAAAMSYDTAMPTRIDPLGSLGGPTLVGEAVSPPPRPRSSTGADLTPLPAPLPPPMASLPDLRPYVAGASGAGGFGEQTSEQTMPREPGRIPSQPARRVIGDTAEADALGTLPTQLPTDLPSEVRALRTPSAAQKVPTPSAQLKVQAATSSAQHRAQTPAPSGPHKTQPPPTATLPYAEPQKGAFGSFSRAIDFFQQMFALAGRERTLYKPMIYDIAIATPVSLAIALLLLVIRSANGVYLVMLLGTVALYFIDYACNALTASLIYDYLTAGTADLQLAAGRVRHGLKGVLTFASVSAFLDVASTYARERHDVLSKILLQLLRAIWTTATYVIMPAMIIEGVSFSDAVSRSKKLMDQDPTGVGAGVVALSLCSYFCAAILFPVAFFLMRVGAHVHPIVGVVLFFMVVNAYWAISGWMKIAYSTCFYLWARRCAEAGQPDQTLAPVPLRHALAAG